MSGRLKILLVDDEPVVIEILEYILRYLSYEVKSFNSSYEGFAYLMEQVNSPPDGLILDVDLPEMDGWVFLKRARQIFPQIPVLFVSGHADVGDRIKGMNRVGFLMKPFQIDELNQAMNCLLECKARDEQV